MREYEFYIFDLDNTIVNSRSGYEEAFIKAFKEFGIPYDPARYDEYISTPLSITFSNYHPNSPCMFRDFTSVFMNAYDQNHMNGVRLFPDAERCLTSLHKEGRIMGVVSNSYEAHIRGILSKLGVLDLFTSIVGYDCVSFPKPDPEPVLLCLSEMGASKDSSVMVGDSANDIIAAKNAGIEAVLIDRCGNRNIDVKADLVISSLDEMLQG